MVGTGNSASVLIYFGKFQKKKKKLNSVAFDSSDFVNIDVYDLDNLHCK